MVHSIESVPLDDHRPESEKTLFDHVKENNLPRLMELLTPPDIQELDEYGMALIHWATDRNAVDIIEFLVKSGASVNQRDAEQQTPLHYAASCGHVEALRCLLALHANPTLCDSEGQTCLDVADDEQICTVLRLEKGTLAGSRVLIASSNLRSIDSTLPIKNHCKHYVCFKEFYDKLQCALRVNVLLCFVLMEEFKGCPFFDADP